MRESNGLLSVVAAILAATINLLISIFFLGTEDYVNYTLLIPFIASQSILVNMGSPTGYTYLFFNNPIARRESLVMASILIILLGLVLWGVTVNLLLIDLPDYVGVVLIVLCNTTFKDLVLSICNVESKFMTLFWLHISALLMLSIFYISDMYYDVKYWVYALVYLPGWLSVLYRSTTLDVLKKSQIHEVFHLVKKVFINGYTIIPAIFLGAYGVYYSRLEISLFAVNSYESIIFLYSLSSGLLLPLLTSISKGQLNKYLSTMDRVSSLNKELKYIFTLSLLFMLMSYVIGPPILSYGFDIEVENPFIIVFFIAFGLTRYFISIEMNILHVVKGTHLLAILTSLPSILVLAICFFFEINSSYKFLVMLQVSTGFSLLTVYIFAKSSESLAKLGALLLFTIISIWLPFY